VAVGVGSGVGAAEETEEEYAGGCVLLGVKTRTTNLTINTERRTKMTSERTKEKRLPVSGF
jgi:hypothetical protein